MPLSPRELADRFHEEWLAENPFSATMYGIPGHDGDVPDESPEGEAAWRSRLIEVFSEAQAVDTTTLSEPDRVTLACVIEAAERDIVGMDLAASDHTVTSMPFAGPAVLFAVLARTVLLTSEAAGDYVTRLQRSGTWLDQLTDRLRDGAGRGRLPVAPLVAQAITWADEILSKDVPAAVSAPQPPAGWPGESSWRDDRDAAAHDVIKPALARWVSLLRELLPQARPADQPGLIYLAGGDADYAGAIRLHTTLPLTPEQLHQTGLDNIAALEERALELGARIGLHDLPSVLDAIRASAGNTSPEESMAAARDAVRRAEARAGEVFPAPLPPPCDVSPMPDVVAASGMAPHYSPPRLDGGRPGTYWFNTAKPTAGTGWDLEGVAFHEAVPGHHLQLSRLQLLTDLPALQRQRSLTVFSEGWGLYAEQLAEEIGLYSNTESLLGAVTASLMRAARLVVDTGLHHFGWSREKAVQFFVDHVPLPRGFCESEVDRYIIMPGQALAYLTGKLELLRLRDEAKRRLNGDFSLPAFHSAVLDSGSLPLPVLREHIDTWSAGAT
ncbi:MAG TPA: DUF885 domain-containing protein, partial [Mycobacteriales bacterium]|nr:DUF885 domain-containing protein [Mycobacteriales bacterium]